MQTFKDADAFWRSWFCKAHFPIKPHDKGTCFVCNGLKMVDALESPSPCGQMFSDGTPHPAILNTFDGLIRNEAGVHRCLICESEQKLRADHEELKAERNRYRANLEIAEKLALDKVRELTALREEMAALVEKLKRNAKSDCDPANGSAIAQAQGRMEALIAKEIATILNPAAASGRQK